MIFNITFLQSEQLLEAVQLPPQWLQLAKTNETAPLHKQSQTNLKKYTQIRTNLTYAYSQTQFNVTE
ncbi:hypothetical protein Hanom_Chr15g01396301 [Helianthus anomalus]